MEEEGNFSLKEDFAPLVGGHARPWPVVERLASSTHSTVDVLGIALSDLGKHVLTPWVDGGECFPRRGVHELTIDEQLRELHLHRRLLRILELLRCHRRFRAERPHTRGTPRPQSPRQQPPSPPPDRRHRHLSCRLNQNLLPAFKTEHANLMNILKCNLQQTF
jgi:hypothetical protein